MKVEYIISFPKRLVRASGAGLLVDPATASSQPFLGPWVTLHWERNRGWRGYAFPDFQPTVRRWPTA